MKKKHIVIPFAALSLIAIVAFSNVKSVNAYAASNKNEFVSKIAERFGLDRDVVQETYMEFRALKSGQKHEQMHRYFEERINQAQEAGKISAPQRLEIMQKHEEMNNFRDDMYNLSPEDRREMMADHHEQMEKWAERNGIDADVFMQHSRRGEHNQERLLKRMR